MKKHLLSLNNILAFFVLITHLFSFAQTNKINPEIKFHVKGKLSIDQSDVKGASVILMRDSTVIKTVKNKSNYNFELDYNHRYLIMLSKDGYITKTVEFLTTGLTVFSWNKGFKPYRMQITLFKQPADKLAYHTQPIGVVYYNPLIDSFDYKVNYDKYEIDR